MTSDGTTRGRDGADAPVWERTARGRAGTVVRVTGAAALAVAALVLAPVVLGIVPLPPGRSGPADRGAEGDRAAASIARVATGASPAAREPEPAPPGSRDAGLDAGLPRLRPRVAAPPAVEDSRTPAERREARAAKPGRPEITRGDFPPPEELPPEERRGIGLFPPPGTSPPQPGIIVPEDFELPPGYVRHYQATDDGQMLPAILMYSPDYEWVDDQGRPMPMPESRIVDPAHAPPGMPIQILEPPGAPAKPGAKP